MKKWLSLIIASLLLYCSATASAEPINFGTALEKLELGQGVVFDAQEANLKYIMDQKVYKYKDVSFSLGYTSTQGLAASASYPIFKAADYEIDIPVIKWLDLNFGYSIGIDRIDIDDGLGDGNNEFFHGLYASLIKIKF